MRPLLFALILLFSLSASAQKKSAADVLPRPKLVVGIVVDQMRWDYLYRYYDRYTAGGFKRLLKDGFSCENTLIAHTPTHTAPGHASIYTGSVPAINGIVGNNWYNRYLGRSVYCAEDNEVQTVGAVSDAGKMSPKNMQASTITDELRLAQNFKNKTIAIAIKDRGAILPGGHTATGAYWFDNASGGWITSTYYMKELPDWVKKVNDQRLPDTYLKNAWSTLYPMETYTQSSEDKKPYEGKIPGEGNSFPHRVDTITKNKYEVFRYTPAGNTITFNLAKEAVNAEGLGSRDVTDFLALSFSTPDYIGHTFGPNSVEEEDNYLRLDKDLADFLNFLDSKIGKGQYTVFLTADHGAAQVPGFLKENKLPAGTLDDAVLMRMANDSLQARYGVKGIISQATTYQFFLNHKAIAAAKLDETEVKAYIRSSILRTPGLMDVVDLANLQQAVIPERLKTMLTNGYNAKLSGDMQLLFQSQWFDGGATGTSHGIWAPYDAHIPLVWYGWGIKGGKTNRETYMTDIAATAAALLHVQMPSGCIGKVIEEVIR